MELKKQLTPFELTELIKTFYQLTISPLPNFKKEMELTFEVSQKEYEQYGDIIYERTGKSDQFKHRISGIVLTYQNVKDINCECIIAQTNCEMYEISFGNRFWVTLIIINVPKEIIIQNNTYKSCGNISWTC